MAARSCDSPTAACPMRSSRRATRKAGRSTSAASPWPPPAAIQAPIPAAIRSPARRETERRVRIGSFVGADVEFPKVHASRNQMVSETERFRIARASLFLFASFLIFSDASAASRGFSFFFGEQAFSVDDTGPCVKNPKYITISAGQSIQAALGQVGPGTVIKVEPGIYTGCVDLSGLHGDDGNPIILISETLHAARIVGDS